MQPAFSKEQGLATYGMPAATLMQQEQAQPDPQSAEGAHNSKKLKTWTTATSTPGTSRSGAIASRVAIGAHMCPRLNLLKTQKLSAKGTDMLIFIAADCEPTVRLRSLACKRFSDLRKIFVETHEVLDSVETLEEESIARKARALGWKATLDELYAVEGDDRRSTGAPTTSALLHPSLPIPQGGPGSG